MRRPNNATPSGGATSMALQQMMPYHLVPQREAMLVQQQQQQSEAGVVLPTRRTPGQQVGQLQCYAWVHNIITEEVKCTNATYQSPLSQNSGPILCSPPVLHGLHESKSNYFKPVRFRGEGWARLRRRRTRWTTRRRGRWTATSTRTPLCRQELSGIDLFRKS